MIMMMISRTTITSGLPPVLPIFPTHIFVALFFVKGLTMTIRMMALFLLFSKNFVLEKQMVDCGGDTMVAVAPPQ